MGSRPLNCASLRKFNTAIGLSGFNFNKDGSYNKVIHHLRHAEIIEGFSGVATYNKHMPMIDELNQYNLRPQTHASLKTINPIEKAQFLSDDYIISTYFKQKGINTIVCCIQECNFSNCVNVLGMGNKSDALHNLNTGGNMYNYNVLRGFYNK